VMYADGKMCQNGMVIIVEEGDFIHDGYRVMYQNLSLIQPTHV